jgi:hypothetical protein
MAMIALIIMIFFEFYEKKVTKNFICSFVYTNNLKFIKQFMFLYIHLLYYFAL